MPHLVGAKTQTLTNQLDFPRKSIVGTKPVDGGHYVLTTERSER